MRLLTLLLAAVPVFAGDFWNEKRYSQWEPAEVQRLLTHSPWAETPGPATVRWESALPVQMAIARKEQGELSVPGAPKQFKDYVISVSGLPPGILPGEARERRELLLTSARLKPARKPAAYPDEVRLSDGTVHFYFARDQAITTADKDVEFSLRLGKTVIRVKFRPSEMLFNGQLAL